MIAILIIYNHTTTEIYKDTLVNLMNVIYTILPNHIDVKFTILTPYMYEKEYYKFNS
jgi:hypothetical protein